MTFKIFITELNIHIIQRNLIVDYRVKINSVSVKKKLLILLVFFNCSMLS